MYAPEEVAKVLDDIRPWLAQEEDLAEGHEAAWSAFVNRARDNLHLVITMSPVGDGFRNR
jgi:dynein heavy chain